MYDFDANGNILHTQRWDNTGQQYDDMTYGYHEAGGNRVRNRLYHVKEEADDLVVTDVGDYPEVPTDITDQDNALGTINTANNFSYDALGNLKSDAVEQIERIDWTVAGKAFPFLVESRPAEGSRLRTGHAARAALRANGRKPLPLGMP